MYRKTCETGKHNEPGVNKTQRRELNIVRATRRNAVGRCKLNQIGGVSTCGRAGRLRARGCSRRSADAASVAVAAGAEGSRSHPTPRRPAACVAPGSAAAPPPPWERGTRSSPSLWNTQTHSMG